MKEANEIAEIKKELRNLKIIAIEQVKFLEELREVFKEGLKLVSKCKCFTLFDPFKCRLPNPRICRYFDRELMEPALEG